MATSATSATTMQLYHYTAPTTSHLGSILAQGLIRTTESNISPTRPHAGPDVVWLTDSADRDAQAWVTTSRLKLLAVLVVELPADRLHHWPQWSREQGIDDATYEALAASGGDPESWWVTTQPVRRWDIKHLTIAPLNTDGGLVELREFDSAALANLFRSAGARRALALPETRRIVAEPEPPPS